MCRMSRLSREDKSWDCQDPEHAQNAPELPKLPKYYSTGKPLTHNLTMSQCHTLQTNGLRIKMGKFLLT
ncbi:hypothetical protein L208DRAFT_546438 [Tricholoma matsutake]|nr:hypothetical protein L208DRAFT_546438 [Tricholoma matsutake 945]